MNVVAYGGGTDSTAMIIECVNRGIAIDYILFADTGAEKPHTYEYIKKFSAWCVSHGLPAIITVKKGGNGETLEEECIRKKSLPSLAYGFKTCSQKFKIQPQDMFFNNLPVSREIWKRGEKITKFVGYDLTEKKRAEKTSIFK
jgi:3'-phosphoadenosine 5'-phosphosulfate sulfotransferase (PAPS reductase)/FAD synthetase